MLELKVKRLPNGSLVFIDPDGDEHMPKGPRDAWGLLCDLAEQAEAPDAASEKGSDALAVQDTVVLTPTASKLRWAKSPEPREEQVIRESSSASESEGGIIGNVAARAGAAVIDGMTALGKSSDYRHGSRRWR